jgi:hypothetical protein
MEEINLSGDFRSHGEFIITPRLFSYIGDICVKSIILSDNAIKLIEGDAFHTIYNYSQRNMTLLNQRTVNCLQIHWCYFPNHVGHQDMIYQHIPTNSENLVQCIILSDNAIKLIEGDALLNMKYKTCLENLDLSYNKFDYHGWLVITFFVLFIHLVIFEYVECWKHIWHQHLPLTWNWKFWYRL